MCSGPGALHSILRSPYGSDPFMLTVPTNWKEEDTKEECAEDQEKKKRKETELHLG